MNADLRAHDAVLEPTRLGVPEAAWTRLRTHLGQSSAHAQAWEASFAYGVPFDELRALIDHWRDELELPARLVNLPCFEARLAGQRLRFVHARSRDEAAVPLLLLHGYSGSLVELGSLAPALTDASCHVVSPALPGFGSSCASPAAFVDACAALMQELGYSRYAVHGSDVGASLALELGAADRAHVAAVHVSHVPAYPTQAPADVASLSAEEKSRLARLTELHEQLQFQLPETPVEELAFALSRLDDAAPRDARLRDDLLTNLTLSYAFGDAGSRAALYRSACLVAAPPSDVPVAVQELPLAVPSLRRFAERRHRIVDWQTEDLGGPAPAIEQPAQLLQALTRFCERLR